MLKNYLVYLEFITKKIQNFFEEQSDFICCKKGCSICCKNAQFPYSEIEFRLIYKGLKELNPIVQKQILDKVDVIIKEKQKHNEKTPNEKFKYDCPFLINNICSVYQYRGLICRMFGLMTFSPYKDQKTNIPFCAYQGLNYSTVLEDVKNNVLKENFLKQENAEKLKAYNVEYETLIKEETGKDFGFEFGEVKPLIEWFIKWKEEIIEKLN